jgi:hypothetical protein
MKREASVVMRLSESQILEVLRTKICWTNYPAGATGWDKLQNETLVELSKAFGYWKLSQARSAVGKT